MGYYVYINGSSNNCSGWLDVKNDDIAVNGHFMEWATEFASIEEAIAAANKRLDALRELCEKTEENLKKHPMIGGNGKIEYNAEHAMKKYKFFVFQSISMPPKSEMTMRKQYKLIFVEHGKLMRSSTTCYDKKVAEQWIRDYGDRFEIKVQSRMVGDWEDDDLT